MNISELMKDIRKDHERPKTLNSKVLIVDGLNAYKRAFSVTPTLNDDGEHIGGITGFFVTISYAIKLIQPTRCIIVFKGNIFFTNREELPSIIFKSLVLFEV